MTLKEFSEGKPELVKKIETCTSEEEIMKAIEAKVSREELNNLEFNKLEKLNKEDILRVSGGDPGGGISIPDMFLSVKNKFNEAQKKHAMKVLANELAEKEQIISELQNTVSGLEETVLKLTKQEQAIINKCKHALKNFQ